MDQIKQVKVSDIKVGKHEQRLDKEDMEIVGMAASIRRIGILVPLIVTSDGDDFLLVAGHRRLEAAKKAGLLEVPVIIKDCDDAKQAEITFAENFFKKDLSPVELASAIKDCFENHHLTIKEMGEGFNRSEHWVTSMMAISDWPEDVQIAIHKEAISVSAASNLAIINEPEYRAFLVRNAVEQGATARTTAAWLQAWRAMQPQEQAVQAEPLPAGQTPVPMVPQAPCFCCSNILPVNQMSHVPLCGECVQTIRKAGLT